MGDRGSKYYYKCAIIGPPFNAGLLSFVIFQGIRTSIAKKPYTFVIFQGESGPPPPGSAHCVFSSFAIISQRKGELVVYFNYFLTVVCLLMFCDSSSHCRGLVCCLWSVIVAFVFNFLF